MGKINAEDIFFEELEKCLEAETNLLETQNVYKELFGLRGLFITTNADRYFDKYFKGRVVFKLDEFDPSNRDRTKLYHIHGSIIERSSLVFTIPEYIRRYNELNFKKFLEEIFARFTVLFVGYGMSEFELLDFLITKFDRNKEKKPKHFILYPFYMGEESKLKFENAYFNPMGVHVLPYVKDDKGYNQLYEVIRVWSREINQTSNYLYDSFKEIDQVVNDFTSKKAKKVLQIIRNDQPLRDYFFKALSKTDNTHPWLKLLLPEGYFDPPKLIEINSWFILNFLENAARQNSKKYSQKSTDILVELINATLAYLKNEPDKIGIGLEYTIFVVIFSLPIEKINEEYLDIVSMALRSEGDSTLIDSDIGEVALPKLLSHNAKDLLLKLLDIILDFKKVNAVSSDKYVSRMEDYWFYKSLEKYKPEISKLCPIEAADIAILKMRVILEEDESQFSNVWIPTIEDHPQTMFRERYECQLVYFVRDMLASAFSPQMKKLVQGLLNEKNQS